MRVHVLLKFIKEVVEKRYNATYRAFYRFFSQVKKVYNTGGQMLDSFHHMILILTLKSHLVDERVRILSLHTLLYNVNTFLNHLWFNNFKLAWRLPT